MSKTLAVIRQQLGGTEPSISDDGKRVSMTYTPDTAMLNPVGTIFGGYISAMLDDLLGASTWLLSGQRAFVTTHLSVNFLNAAHAGEPLQAEGWLIKHGKRLAVAEGTLRRADGELVAKATATQSFASPPGSADGDAEGAQEMPFSGD